ncbi:MAG: biotin-dependent carboxyltransferase family protein [Pseudomonadota bacterium]
MRRLIVKQIGPGASLQDLGRPGHLAHGLTRGGAMDSRALFEGAALLGQPANNAAIEFAGIGGIFEAEADTRIALTGASMQAECDGSTLAWHASHTLAAGQLLKIGPAASGIYGYLHVDGGFESDTVLGSRSTHSSAGIGRPIGAGDRLELGQSRDGRSGYRIKAQSRFAGGAIRIVPSVQTGSFPNETLNRFLSTRFVKHRQASRQAARLDFEGAGFSDPQQLSVVSEIIVPGDIQVTGDGTPFVLLAECQTTGGYPRIGTVIPSDLPIIAQAQPGSPLTFELIGISHAAEIERRARKEIADLNNKIELLVRDPADIADLLGYQLVSGVTNGTEPEGD